MMNQTFAAYALSTALTLLLPSMGWARGSQAEDSAKQSKTYEALVGNHASIKVEVDEEFILVSDHRSFDKEIYILHWKDSSIERTLGEVSDVLRPYDADYSATLELMRDLVAYTTVPQRYTWNVFGTEPLNLDLNEMTAKLDALVSKFKGFSPNCVIFAGTAGTKLEVSVGARGDLGALAGKVTGAWVRGGYELVLVPAAHFSLDKGPAEVIANPERVDQYFDLAASGAQAASLACRPAIF